MTTMFPSADWTVIITRSETDDGPLARGLAARGARVVAVPTLEHRPPADLSEAIAATRLMGEFDWIVFSSARGVEALERIADSSLRVYIGAIACIGDATREAVEKAGARVTVIGRNAGAEGLIEALRKRSDVAGARVLLPQSNIARKVLAEGLRELGAKLEVVTVYETVSLDNGRELLGVATSHSPSAILFSSPSAARCLGALTDEERRTLLAKSVIGSMGPTTSAALREAGVEPHFEPDERSFDGFAEATARAAAERIQ